MIMLVRRSASFSLSPAGSVLAGNASSATGSVSAHTTGAEVFTAHCFDWPDASSHDRICYRASQHLETLEIAEAWGCHQGLGCDGVPVLRAPSAREPMGSVFALASHIESAPRSCARAVHTAEFFAYM